MKKAKGKNVTKAMHRLLAATEPPETQAALRQLRQAAINAPPKKRAQFQKIAEREARNYAIAQAMKLEPNDQIRAIYQELVLLKPQLATPVGDSKGVEPMVGIPATLSLFPNHLSEAKNPEAVHQLIQNTLSQVSVNPSPFRRMQEYSFILREMEDAILDWFWQIVGERRELYLSSLYLSLQATNHSSLALAFLCHCADENIFFSVAPASLADMDDPDMLKRALTYYRTALQSATKKEAQDCGRELKKAILLRLIDWLDDEGLTQHRNIGLCTDQLQKLLNGDLDTGDRWEHKVQEPFSKVLDAVNSALSLGVELDDDTLDANWADHAELLTRCLYSNRVLVDFTEFALVCRILQAVELLKEELPPALDILVRTYLVVCLSGDCMLSDDASFHWIIGEDTASLAA